jgi:predicted dehydrogenase/NADPH:quinone reductase-like Zn-dependent oxidoreductase
MLAVLATVPITPKSPTDGNSGIVVTVPNQLKCVLTLEPIRSELRKRRGPVLQVAIARGEVRVVDVPEPALQAGGVLVKTSHSLISVGTESAGIGGGGKKESLVVKAIRNPDLVRKVVDRVTSHGLQSTMDLVRSRMENEQPSGYSCAGDVLEVAPGVTAFRPGDRVACCGAGYANHAAVNCVPQNLVARIPEGVSFDEAAFGTLGAIALQGIRRCAPTMGDRVVVVGLGLLGQMTVQMLQASGAVAIGVDVRDDRVQRALSLGMSDGFNAAARDFVAGVLERTGERGADAVIVTAAGGDASLLNRSFDACRKKGRVVLVGDVPIRIMRDKIYKKELDFFISTSYGPGRYDPEYEEKGHDYPLAYVRWTEGRNLEEVLRQIAAKVLQVKPLIDAVYPIEKACDAYASLASEKRPIGVLLDYHLDREEQRKVVYLPKRAAAPTSNARAVKIGVIGYGSYFRAMLFPLIKAHAGFITAAVCDKNGLTVRGAVEKDGFARGCTDYEEILSDPEIQAVYVATRHNLHYPIARAAIEAGKAVHVEKPMALNSQDARQLLQLVEEKRGILTIGFNRRFSPHSALLKKLLVPIAGPKTISYRVNAGMLPADHWLMDPVEGGGRLIGEGVHFFDYLAFLTGSEPVQVHAASPGGKRRDEAIVMVEFADGSVGTLVYAGSGSGAAGKERVEVFAGGATFVLDDYSSLQVFGAASKGLKTSKIEKGQKEQLENFYQVLRGRGDLGVTALDGYRATVCAERAIAQRQAASS